MKDYISTRYFDQSLDKKSLGTCSDYPERCKKQSEFHKDCLDPDRRGKKCTSES